MGYGYLSCKAETGIIEVCNEKPLKLKMKTFEYSDLEAATNNFSDEKLLGRGSHGLVYKALLPCGRTVAVKKPSRNHIPDEFHNEIHILSNLHSPTFVNLLGYTPPNTSSHRLLVVEFMSNGTLYDLLHTPTPTKLPNWGRRLRFALQIATALHTLHSQSPPVIHRDIKSANVLLDTHLNARLADFGLALRCNLHDFKLRSTPPAGTIGYLDPSYVTPHHLSTHTDVFSFGILLLEILSARKAIDISHSPPSILDWAIPLVRKGKLLSLFDPRIAPPKDPMLRKQLAVIAAKCVRSNPERRPSMIQIVEALDRLTKLVPLHSWNAFTNPCLMLDNVGHPVGLPNANLSSRLRGFECGNSGDVNGNKLASPLKNTRRVYSDLGFRNNLMDLMADPYLDSEYGGEDEGDQKSQAPTRGSNLRIASERYGDKGRMRSVTRFNDGVVGGSGSGSLVQLRKSILERKKSQIAH
ncbi:hypothetical protein vseg_006504 [Gypsophila vaccaria]